MGHMLPPDDGMENKPMKNPKDEVKDVNSSFTIKFFSGLVILMGIIILLVLLKSYLDNRQTNKSLGGNPYSNNENGTLGNGSSLGGAMGGAGDDEMPTPESLAREFKGGGAMKVMISGPNGEQQIIDVSPEQMKAMSKPVGGDTTEATPVGGAGGGD